MGDKTCKKLVKVDNWGMFFLQRLQQHFSRDEFCDFTLHFTNGEKIQAHRLVLDVCTEYFQILQTQGLFVGNFIHMPEDMLPDVVIPVVNFMYTGRLEFRADIQERLYATAQKMKMTVLTKLLDAQSLNTQQQLKTQQAAKLKLNQVVVSPKKLPPGTFTNLQGKKVSPRVVDPNLPVTLPGRKLPIWKRRSTPIYSQTSHTSTSITQFDQPIRIITSSSTSAINEAPRPTRFEWPEDTDEPSTSPLAATFEDISYESKPLMQLRQPKPSITVKEKAPATPMQAEKKATFEDVYRTGAVGMAKRPATDPISSESAKKAKTMDLQAMKEYVREAHVRSRMIEGEDSDDDDDIDDDLAEAEMNNDEEEEDDEDDDDEDASYEQLAQPHKSILKTPSSADEESSSNKRVRFSVDDGPTAEKENEVKTPEPRALPTRALSNITSSSTPTATNHAKIISEVLKKYPHLVKNNKNIRLKIMQRGGSSQVAVERDTVNRPVKSKVSYVVLKSDVASGKGKQMAPVGSKYVVPHVQRTTFTPKPSGAENVAGPWLCHSCGTNDEPMDFETYYSYRHHLQDVHMEKIDARICEHCGHRASKRNLLLYHQFTKHSIAPPRNCQFPKCDQCEYVALSESLLIKHRNNHSSANRDYICRVCLAPFKSSGALAGHMQTNLHSDHKKSYECPHCAKPFVRNINLKAHIRMSHKDLAKRLDDEDVDEGEVDENELGEEDGDMEAEDGEGMMEVPVLDITSENASGMTILAEAPASLEPSSEAEGLSHVASGIATSLGLTDGQQTVILLDNNQEYILHTTEVEGTEYGDEDGTLVQGGASYIVPQLADGEEADHMEEGDAEDEEDEGEVPVESYGTESDIVQNSGEVLMVLTDHCYAEDKDDNQLKENHSQNTIHLQTNELGGLDFVRDEDIGTVKEGSVVGEHDKTNRIVFASKSRQTKVLVTSPPPLCRLTTNAEAPCSAGKSPAAVKKPAVEMSHLLDDWDEECTEEGEDEKGSAVPNSQGAMPTRDEMYIMPSTIVQEDSFLPGQDLESSMEEGDLPSEAVPESQLPEESIENKLLVSENFDNEQGDDENTAESDAKEQLEEHSTEVEDQHPSAEANVENVSFSEDLAEGSTTVGLELPVSNAENSGNNCVPSTGEVDQAEVSAALIDSDVNQNENLTPHEGEEGTQCSQDIVGDTGKMTGKPIEVAGTNHNMELSDENEIDKTETAEVADNESIVNSEPEIAGETEKDTASIPLPAENISAVCVALQADQPSKD